MTWPPIFSFLDEASLDRSACLFSFLYYSNKAFYYLDSHYISIIVNNKQASFLILYIPFMALGCLLCTYLPTYLIEIYILLQQ